MELFQIVMLSLIQGLTEFLPISSSAHLILPAQVFGWQDQGLAFDVAVHVGTLLAVLMYFHREVGQLAMGWGRSLVTRQQCPQSRMAWAVIIGTIPACLAGLLFSGVIEQHLRATWVIAATTILFGVLLWWSDKNGTQQRGCELLRWKDVLIIGCAQALALIPGTSRSGITITAALALGLTRQGAARFSFLLSIPLILAAGSLKGLELYKAGAAAHWNEVLLGAGLAFIAAFSCIHLFLKALDRIGMMPFVLYRLALGGVLMFLLVM